LVGAVDAAVDAARDLWCNAAWDLGRDVDLRRDAAAAWDLGRDAA
jgi:hypothetical protein